MNFCNKGRLITVKGFLTYFKVFSCFVICFLSIILVITIPPLIDEHSFWKLIILIAISVFLLLILYCLNRYYNSMALEFDADDEYTYLTYANEQSVSFKHSEVEFVKCGSMRYIFSLQNGQRFYLTKIEDRKFRGLILHVDEKVLEKIKECYRGKIRY